MSSFKLDKNLSEKTAGDLKVDLTAQKKMKKAMWTGTLVSAGIFAVILILTLLLTWPAVIVAPFFLLALVFFMLYSYNKQNIAELKELLEEKGEMPPEE